MLAGALLLAACNGEPPRTASLAIPRGGSVAFESIDGPPPAVFQKLVRNLNTEAQARRLAVVSRDGQSAYRIRGYLAARKEGRNTAISWVWDIMTASSSAACASPAKKSCAATAGRRRTTPPCNGSRVPA
jgi:hypothetical protein